MSMRVRWLLLLMLGPGACTTGTNGPPPPPPPRQPVDMTLPSAPDRNADPRILEIELEAGEATKQYGDAPATNVWAYNGSVPGPLLDVAVGDRLIIHFTNHLPEETTIHWHGVRVPATMDGTLAMQSPIPSGGTFTYDFVARDAGLFWYHPHMRSDIQVQKGLYGAIRVRGPDEPTVDQELILMLDDIRLRPDGTLNEYLDDNGLMLGREGNTLLVNGVVSPLIALTPGALVRLRVVNVANGRFFNLRLDGLSWRVIGGDGGLLPESLDAEHVLLSPGERADLVFVAPTTVGMELPVVSDPYERGHGTSAHGALEVARFQVQDGTALSGRVLPAVQNTVELLPDGENAFTITLDEGIRDGQTIFTVNGETYPDVPAISVVNGTVAAFDVRNTSEMDHPFHLHGFFFQVLASNGVAIPPERRANKDTIIVPAESTLHLVSRLDEPGSWMYHCHILEHAEAGMMGELRVE
ncbi:MAG: multicopper oxidase family protein [Myxococcota bacterium]